MIESRPVLQVALTNPQEAQAMQQRLQQILGDRASVVTDAGAQATARLVSLADLPSDSQETTVAVGEADLPSLVSLLRSRPWLAHVVSLRVLEGDSLGVVGDALWKLLSNGKGLELAPFLAPPGRHALITDSDQRNTHVEAISKFARESGGSPLGVERIRDMAEETITNALYNAPAEKSGQPTIRSRRVQLEGKEACEVSYCVRGKLFLLRVRDGFGSFTRKRLCEVLERCMTQGGVALDTSRGGAGLGLWRMFSTASVVMIHVQPRRRTEIVLGLELNRRSMSGPKAVHLFFDAAESDS